MKKLIILACTHLGAILLGFAVGIYALPILTAPPAPSADEMTTAKNDAVFTGEFTRDLKGSDFLHWGEGTVSIGQNYISLEGEVAPGPDYKLYLSSVFVEDESEFNANKENMVQIANIKTFENFVASVPSNIDTAQFNTVIVWCESFGEFITSAKYQ